MAAIDFTCFVGSWPFHRTRSRSLKDLSRLHEENQITGGYVSSLHGIFYNDPFEAEEELEEELAGLGNYRHVATVNPTLPGWKESLKRALARWEIYGVRIYPGFHGYSLNGPEMGQVTELCVSLGLPIFIMVHMEDERFTFLFQPRALEIAEMREFLKSGPGGAIVFCNIRASEIETLAEEIVCRPNIFCDCSGFKEIQFLLEKLTAQPVGKRLLYGSMAPLYCMKGSLLALKLDCSPEAQEEILSGKHFMKFI